ncbi:hypothetical protein QUA79_11690 [Microcoleus sp. F8-D1]
MPLSTLTLQTAVLSLAVMLSIAVGAAMGSATRFLGGAKRRGRGLLPLQASNL